MKRRSYQGGREAVASLFDFSVLRELRKRENLTLSEVAEKSGISPAVVSKLERNQTSVELSTLFRLGRVFGLSATDLLSLAEIRTGHKTRATSHRTNGFAFQEVAYGNVRCLVGTAPAGGKMSRPEVHGDDYEVCWVRKGRLRFTLPNESHELQAGEAIQFDAVLEHSYEALEDCEVVLVHLRKGKRF